QPHSRLALVPRGDGPAVTGVRAVERPPPDAGPPLDLQRLVAHQLRGISRHGLPWEGSGSRGRPSTRSPRMFLLTSVVPPSMVLARLRSMPFTSYGMSPPPFAIHAVEPIPSRSAASSCRRWLSPAACTLPTDAAGPGV